MNFLKKFLFKSIKLYYRLTHKNLLKGDKALKGSKKREKCSTTDEILSTHFGKYTNSSHPCKETLSIALKELAERPANIIETGSSAWGANSSMLFDLYVSNFGGSFNSVDIRVDPAISLSWKCSNYSNFWCNDSVNWLSKLKLISEKKIDLFYLDSWDVNPSSPVESAIHGLNEFLTILCNLEFKQK